MKSFAQLVLLCALCGVGYGVPQVNSYVPEILQANIAGKITQTTAAIEQPLCVFDNIQPSCSTCEVWLVVDNVTSTIPSAFDINNSHVIPSNFMSEDFLRNGFYLTVRTVRTQYQCLPTLSPNGQIFTLRVGNEAPCVTPNCNAPLPTGATFRVRYILLNPSLNSNNVVAVTQWSNNIKLLNAIDPNSISAFTRRSGGMIVITTILSILLFLLLVLFIVMLALVCCKRSGKSDFPEPITTFGSLRRYNTHSLQNKGKIISQKGNI